MNINQKNLIIYDWIMENKIKKIMAEIFDIEVSEINSNTYSDTLEQWDSIKHMDLIIALEEEFNIKFDAEEIIQMISYDLIFETIKAKI